MRKPTIYEALTAELGREPTNAECAVECRRIIHGSDAPRYIVNGNRRVKFLTLEGAQRRAAKFLPDIVSIELA